MRQDQFTSLLEKQEELTKAVLDDKKRYNGGEITEVLSKIAIGVCTAGVLLISGFLINMNTNMALFAQDQTEIRRDIDSLKEQFDERDEEFQKFTSRPRFTNEDSEGKLQPIRIDIKEIQSEFRLRGQRFQGIEERLINIERDIGYLTQEREIDARISPKRR